MKSIYIALALFISSFATDPAFASNSKTDQTAVENNFVKKRYSIKGNWDIKSINGQTVIQFDDNFKTKSGPDLKVYLSKNSLSESTSKSVDKTSVKLSVLKSNRGHQSYIIPENINISEFESVLIHCEAFSVLWGGFDISQTP